MAAGEEEGLRVIVVGDDGVGKTAFVLSARGKSKTEHGKVLAAEKPVQVSAGRKETTVTLWDTVGSAEHERLRPLAYPTADAFVICFNVVNPASFENVRKVWHPEVRFTCPDAKILLMGLKTDLRTDDHAQKALQAKGAKPVTQREALQLVKEIAAHSYCECSSEDVDTVNEAMVSFLPSFLFSPHSLPPSFSRFLFLSLSLSLLSLSLLFRCLRIFCLCFYH
jgi:small GTP-binding protein